MKYIRVVLVGGEIVDIHQHIEGSKISHVYMPDGALAVNELFKSEDINAIKSIDTAFFAKGSWTCALMGEVIDANTSDLRDDYLDLKKQMHDAGMLP